MPIPSGLTANLNGPQQVILTWWGTANATNYLVKRATTSGGPYTTIATITTNLLTYTDTNVTNGVTYYYTVSALTPLGESGNATEVNVSVQPQLVAYYKFNESSGTNAADATGHGWTGALVNGATWSDRPQQQLREFEQQQSAICEFAERHHNEPGRLHYRRMGVSEFRQHLDAHFRFWRGQCALTAPPRRRCVICFSAPQSSSGVVRFAITTGGGGAEQQINGVAALPASGWHHVAVTLAGNTGVLYVDGARVGSNTISITPLQLGSTTQNWIGRSQYSNPPNSDPYLNGKVDDFRIYNGALSAAQIAALAAGYPVQPPAPTNVVATAVSANQINLTWSPALRATNYFVKRSIVSGGPYSTVSVPLTVTNFSDTGLVGGTIYYYVIAAANDGGATNSVEVSATTLAAPSAPASLTAIAGLSGAINLTWPASSAATSYNVKRANFSGGPYTVIASNVTTTGYTNTDLFGHGDILLRRFSIERERRKLQQPGSQRHDSAHSLARRGKQQLGYWSRDQLAGRGIADGVSGRERGAV